MSRRTWKTRRFTKEAAREKDHPGGLEKVSEKKVVTEKEKLR
jgi:hypothetical protein